ncbi:MAG: thioredoxin domain-containing protein [Deltaproteobacteria bacterium]
MDPGASYIVHCSKCGAKNRIPHEKAGMQAKCGQCGSPLEVGKTESRAGGPHVYLFRCTECGARNKIPADRIEAGPRCGKCKQPLKTEELFVPQPLRITDGNFQEKVLKSPLPALIFAWAPWCPTCRAFLPVIDDYGRDSKGKVRVGKLNVDENPVLSSSYNILGVPQILIFDHGELKETLPGAMQKHELQNKMAAYA